MKRIPPADPGQLALDLGQAAEEAPSVPSTDSGEHGQPPAGGGPGPTGVPIAGRPALRVGRGPRVVERDLLGALGDWHARVAADPQLLAHPFRLIVPSASLRDHIGGAALRYFGRPLVGISVQTLFATALEVLERSGAKARTGRSLVSVEVARGVAREPALAAAFGNSPRTARIVEATVQDLLDAGLRAADVEPLEEALEELEFENAQVERVRATLRIAAGLCERLEAVDLLNRSQLLTNAASALRDAPVLLPSSRVAIHGFAEATGAATELLEAITRAHPTTIWIDEPAEPGHPERVDPGARFANRLRDRFAPIAISAPTAIEADREQRTTRVAELLAAPGAEPEVRAVAGRIRKLLDEDPTLEPERIGVVARQIGSYSPLLRAHFGRLGIPYSGVGASVPRGASARRVAAVAALLSEGEMCPADRWVGALDSLPLEGGGSEELSRALRADLRLALRHLGASRLRDVAVLDTPDRAIRLPVRSGLSVREGAGGGPVANYRRLEVSVLAGAIARAQSLCERLAGWSETDAAAGHQRRLRSLLQRDLGWQAKRGSAELVALDDLARELPDRFELTRAEFFDLAAERLLVSQTREPVGGLGGGVALLGVMEARARTFEHLFVIGLNRDVFPRPVTEDALLPDALRRELARDVLPDLPIKATGHDEERYLFAQLFASSPSVVLSWLSTSDDGKKRVRSTLVDRLTGSDSTPPPTVVPVLHHVAQLDAPGPRTARELALLAGVDAPLAAYEELVAPALAESWSEVVGASSSAPGDVGAVAASRVSIVREFSRFVEGRQTKLGPYLGLLGPVREAGDLRNAKRYVTSLEKMSRCGWQTALEKLLRLEATPDPLEQFPELTPLVVGSVVHAALEESLGDGKAETLDLAGAMARGPRRRIWPGDDELSASARRCAKRALDEEGLAFIGLERVLGDRVFDHLVRARELWEGGAVDVLAVEVEGALVIEDGPTAHGLSFKADMVEAVEGRTRLTDFKTGTYRGSRAAGAEVRADAFARDVASGKALQAVAYALAAGETGAVGRYLFVRPDVPDEYASSEFEVGGPNDEAVRAGFEGAVRTLGRAWDAGVFLPRLTESGGTETPRACGYCEVKEACVQGDTGLRQRQASFISRARSGASESRGAKGDAATEQIYAALWKLGEKRSRS